MTKKYGETTWSLIIASADSSGAPSGDYIYLFIPQKKGINWKTSIKSQIIRFPGGSSIVLNLGERERSISARDIPIIVSSTKLTNAQAIEDFLLGSHTSGDSPLYVYIQIGTSTYFQFANSSSVKKNYLRAICKNWSFNHKEGQIFLTVSIMEAEG